MNKKRRFNWIVYAVFSSLLLSGCSTARYQSFRDEKDGQPILSRKRWEVQLPYQSGKDLVIEQVSGDGLLLSEAQDQFHLVRIPLDAGGSPGGLKHLQLEHGDSCEVLDDGLILVTGKVDSKAKSVALVEQESLSLRFSSQLPFSEAGEASVPGLTDISVPGSKQIGEVVVLFQSTVKIEREMSSVGGSISYVPYVAWSKYDMHVVNTVNSSVYSFPGLDSGSFEVVRDMVSLSKKAAQGLSPQSFGQSSKQSQINKSIFLLDQFFVVDHGSLLIFSLANLEGDKAYYSLDLAGGAQSPQWRLPSELAARYPEELVATDRPSKNEEGREVTISGKDYRIERASSLPSGIVLVASEVVRGDSSSGGDDEHPARRVIMGVRPATGRTMQAFERVWEYTPKYKGAISDFLEDSQGGVIYFPELLSEGWFTMRFKVQGLTAADGKAVEGFPANFKEESKAGKKDLSIVGTAVDFQRNLLYIHDYEKNHLVCANLR